MSGNPNPLYYQNPPNKNAELEAETVNSAATPPIVREHVTTFPSNDSQMLMASLRQLGEVLLLLEKRLAEPAVPVALAQDHPWIPVVVTDGSDVIGTSTRPIRIDPTGATPQPVQVVGPAWAIGVTSSGMLTAISASVVAASTGVVLQDSGGKLWTLGISPAGSLSTTSIGAGNAISFFLNDPSSTTSWQVGVTTQGMLTTTSAALGNYSTSFTMNSSEPQLVAGAVSITNFPVTQAVSGGVSILNFPATQVISGSISILNFPALQAAQLSDGVTAYDLRLVLVQLRELINSQNQWGQAQATRNGQFVPAVDTLPFLAS